MKTIDIQSAIANESVVEQLRSMMPTGNLLKKGLAGSDLFKSVDFAIIIGAGYQSSMGLLFSLSYNIGLANTINADKFAALPGGSGMEGEKSRNGVLQFNLGWRF